MQEVYCASCRGALARIQQIRLGFAIGAAFTWFILPVLLAFNHVPSPTQIFITGLMPLSLLLVWFGLGHLERRFYEGKKIPPRNQPERRSRK